MPTAVEVFASRLREIRGDRSMAEMADKVGVSRQTWFKYERGEVFPNAARLDELAAALDVIVSEMFEAA